VVVAAAAVVVVVEENLIPGSKPTHTESSTQALKNVIYPEKSILHFIQEILD
jgi:hypothetical protein